VAVAMLAAMLAATWVAPVAVSGQRAQFAPHAMIASNSTPASEAGVEILKRGGNAVDAAVATGFALAVTLPEAGNLAGGGYMVVHMADGRSAAIDYRETAPRAATRTMYVDASGKNTGESLVGYKAAGVPGSVAGLYEVQRRFGRLPFAQVVAPAIRLAEQGFVVDSMTARVIEKCAPLLSRFQSRDVFLRDGHAPAVGTKLMQPALAKTLRAIAAHGAEAFYHGAIAHALAEDMHANGGIVTEEDLAAYKPAWKTPVVTKFHGYTLLGMPLSSSGGITMSRIFAALDTIPIAPLGSVAQVSALTNAMRDAFEYRNTKLGDTTAVASALRQTREGNETTHYSVVDADGNAVSTTTTINSLFGAGAYTGSVGVFWNNEMDDFAVQPGVPNQFGLVMGEQNSVAPGRRPLSSMSPTIVLDSTGKLLLVVGSRGGPRIITSTTQVILNVIDHHLTLADAMRAPRLHHQALPDTLLYEPQGVTSAVADSLKAKGIATAETPSVGLVDAVLRVSGGYEGMDDPRRQAAAVGY